MTDQDRDYYARRVTQAREAARNASDPSIKALHLTLATEYEAKLENAVADRFGGTVHGTP